MDEYRVLYRQVSTVSYLTEIAIKYIYQVVPSVFLGIGIVSNVLAIIVLSRPKLIKESIFCYFLILCAINLARMVPKYVSTICLYNYFIPIRSSSIAACKILVFLTYFVSQSQSLILTAISVDRAFFIYQINKAKVYFTAKAAIIVTMIIFSFELMITAHFLYGHSAYTRVVNNVSLVYCTSEPGSFYQYFNRQIFRIIDLCIYALIPFAVMLICSILIIAKVVSQSNKSHRTIVRNTVPSDELVSNGCHNCMNKCPVISKGFFCCKPKVSKTISPAQMPQSKSSQVALMTIPVNIAFLIFTTPVTLIYYVYTNILSNLIVVGVCEFLSDCNWVFSFLIYYLSNKIFREEAHKLFQQFYKCLFFKRSS